MTNANRTEAQNSLWMEGHKILSTCSSSLCAFKHCNPGIRKAGCLETRQQVALWLCVYSEAVGTQFKARQDQPGSIASRSRPAKACCVLREVTGSDPPHSEVTPKTSAELIRQKRNREGLQIIIIPQINQMYIMTWESRQENTQKCNKCELLQSHQTQLSPLIVSIIFYDCDLKDVKFC